MGAPGSASGVTRTAMTKADALRHEVLDLAVSLFSGTGTGAVTTTRAAETFLAWLTAPPARLVLRRPALTFGQGSPGPGIPTVIRNQGGIMSVSMSDTQQVAYTVEPEDSRGFQVADTLTWSEDSAGAVVAMTASADGLSAEFVAVAPGTANISVTDGTLSGADLITVTPGAVASLVLTPGTPADVAPPAGP